MLRVRMGYDTAPLNYWFKKEALVNYLHSGIKLYEVDGKALFSMKDGNYVFYLIKEASGGAGFWKYATAIDKRYIECEQPHNVLLSYLKRSIIEFIKNLKSRTAKIVSMDGEDLGAGDNI